MGGFAVTVFAENEIYIQSGSTNVTNEPVNELVNERQKMVLSLIKKNKDISINDFSDICKVGRETIKRDLTKLKDFNILKELEAIKLVIWN